MINTALSAFCKRNVNQHKSTNLLRRNLSSFYLELSWAIRVCRVATGNMVSLHITEILILLSHPNSTLRITILIYGFVYT